MSELQPSSVFMLRPLSSSSTNGGRRTELERSEPKLATPIVVTHAGIASSPGHFQLNGSGLETSLIFMQDSAHNCCGRGISGNDRQIKKYPLVPWYASRWTIIL